MTTNGQHGAASDRDTLLRIRKKVEAMEAAEAAYRDSQRETKRLRADWEEKKAEAGAFVRSAVSETPPLFAQAEAADDVPAAANRFDSHLRRPVCRACRNEVGSVDGFGDCVPCGRLLGEDVKVLYADGVPVGAPVLSVALKAKVTTLRQLLDLKVTPRGLTDDQLMTLKAAARAWLARQRLPEARNEVPRPAAPKGKGKRKAAQS